MANIAQTALIKTSRKSEYSDIYPDKIIELTYSKIENMDQIARPYMVFFGKFLPNPAAINH
jgi:hypothetical protein